MARRRSRATDLLVVSQEKFVKVGSRPRKKRDTSSGPALFEPLNGE